MAQTTAPARLLATTRSALLAVLVALVALCAPTVAGAATTGTAYVTTFGSGVIPIDIFSNVTRPLIANPSQSTGIAITPDGTTAYATGVGQNSVVPIDTATDAAGTPITGMNNPGPIAITPDGTTAYVSASGGVQTIDLATGTASSLLSGVGGTSGIAITPDGTTAYATGFSGITAIDTATNTVRTTIPDSANPWGVAITPDGTTGYAANVYGNSVTVFDVATDTVVTTIFGGSIPVALGITPDGATVYVASLGDNTVMAIDTHTNTVVAAIPTGASPYGVAITPDGRTAYVTDRDSNEVTVIDTATNTVTSTLPMAVNGVYGIAITPAQAPVAAFSATVGAARTASFDAAATTVAGATVATYAWDFGDGETETTTSPIASHTYAAAGTYTVAMKATSSDGCSTALVFTGQTASCNGSAGARVEHDVTFEAPVDPPAEPPTPSAPQIAAVTPPVHLPTRKPAVPKQTIDRFTLSARCVRASHSGTARIGLNLRLARPGAVEVAIDRAIDAQPIDRCPRPHSGRRYAGGLHDLKTMTRVGTQPAAASVSRQLALRVKLAPGLYRLTVRARTAGDGLSRPATRWVRVLG